MPINDANNTDEFDNTIVCITGASDQTKIGNVGDALKVYNGAISAGEFQTFKSDTEIVLSSDVTYDILHSVTGEGVFIGATFVSDNTGVELVIEVDGNMIFDFNGDFLKEVVNTDADFRASGIFGCSNDGKRLYFNGSTQIPYSTSLVFKARKSGKKVKYQLYTYSEV